MAFTKEKALRKKKKETEWTRAATGEISMLSWKCLLICLLIWFLFPWDSARWFNASTGRTWGGRGATPWCHCCSSLSGAVTDVSCCWTGGNHLSETEIMASEVLRISGSRSDFALKFPSSRCLWGALSRGSAHCLSRSLADVLKKNLCARRW